MAYVFVADDFTGASDTLATLARAGLKARLFRDLPCPVDLEGLDAWGIATDARALGQGRITALASRLGSGLADFAPDFLHLKICSTFDSSPRTGNFILMARIMARALGIANLAIIGGQPSLGRHAVFGTLFARGPDGRTHRIDRHPVMSVHPVTPMLEADMLRHLAQLGLEELELVPPGAAGSSFPRYYDALGQADVEAAGRDLAAANSRCLVIGSSSVAEAWLAAHDVGPASPAGPAATGDMAGGRPILAFAGSRSSLTTAQIAAAKGYDRFPITPVDMLAGGPRLDEVRNRIAAQLTKGRNCIALLTADPAGPVSAEDLAQASAGFVAGLVETCHPGGLIVAGGDTSSAIVGRLAPAWLDFAGMICPGVPVLKAKLSGRCLPMALKGGQMGEIDFLDRAHAVLRGQIHA